MVGRPSGSGFSEKQNGVRALGRGPLDLGRGGDGIPQRDDGQRHVPARCRAAPLVDHPVVVRAHAQHRQLLVFRLPEELTAKPRERRKAQRTEDPGAVHVGETRDRIVRTRRHLGEGHRRRRELLLALPDRHGETGRRHPLAVVDPIVVRVHTRSEVRVLRRQPVDPHVRRLDQVVVDRHQPVELRRIHVHGSAPIEGGQVICNRRYDSSSEAAVPIRCKSTPMMSCVTNCVIPQRKKP